jgi:gluconolactonase
MELEAYNDKVYELVDPSSPLEKLASGFDKTEGPVYLDHGVYFTDWPASKIYRYEDGKIDLINDRSNNTIGMTYDRKNKRILCCARELHAITDLEGNIIIDNYKGTRINGSNDLVVDLKGHIYFSDPLSRVIEGEQIGHSSVFMYDPETGHMDMLESTLTRPNGVALSLDEKYLFIIDSDTLSIYKMDLATYKKELFIKFDQSAGEGRPDGMRFDCQGNLYTTGPGGVWLVDPLGESLGLIRMPEKAANLCFDDRGLFITAATSIYRVDTMLAILKSGSENNSV